MTQSGRGLSLCLLVFVMLALCRPAWSQSVLDEVDECDLLAAHPSDLQRVADGIADGSIVPRLAVKACEAATRARGDELRFNYQFGRALLANNKRREAQQQFERAAQGNYVAAIAALADMRLDVESRLSVAQANPAAAPDAIKAIRRAFDETAKQHVRAAENGFVPSAQRVQALTFTPDVYGQQIVGHVAMGEFEAARAVSHEPQTRAYVYSLVTNLIGQCGPNAFSAKALANLVAFRFGGGVPKEQEEKYAVETQPLIGEVDSQRFVRRHGCDEQGMLGLLFAGFTGFLEYHATLKR